MPEELVEQLRRVRNKSQFIAQALREKFQKEREKKLRGLLIEGYKSSAKEDRVVEKDWDATLNEGWS